MSDILRVPHPHCHTMITSHLMPLAAVLGTIGKADAGTPVAISLSLTYDRSGMARVCDAYLLLQGASPAEVEFTPLGRFAHEAVSSDHHALCAALLGISLNTTLLSIISSHGSDLWAAEDGHDLQAVITAAGVLITPDDDPIYESWLEAQELTDDAGPGSVETLTMLLIAPAVSAHDALHRSQIVQGMIAWHQHLLAQTIVGIDLTFESAQHTPKID